jgi:hypothetical protein
MQRFARFKFPVLLFGFSILVGMVGAWAKITHQTWANNALGLSLITQALAVAWTVFVVFDRKKPV